MSKDIKKNTRSEDFTKIIDSIKSFYSSGFDLIFAFAFMPLNFNLAFSLLLFLYIVIRLFFIDYILIVVAMNAIFIYGIMESILTVEVDNELKVYGYLILVLITTVLLLTHSYYVVYKSFTHKWRPIFTSSKLYNEAESLSLIEKIINKLYSYISILVAIVYPVLTMLTIIILFAALFNSLNNYYISSGISNLGLLDNNSVILKAQLYSNSYTDVLTFMKSDFFYFSSVTYFTIGYGDIVPSGQIIKILVVAEMLVAQVTNISVFALFGTVFYDFIKKREDRGVTKNYEEEKPNTRILK